MRTTGGEAFHAPRVIVTVSAGVLKAAAGEAGAIAFDPIPASLRDALSGIAMGDVVRLVLCFRTAFWQKEKFLRRARPPISRGGEEIGFLHAFDAPFPTWWTAAPAQVPMLVAWSGGARASALLRLPRSALLAAALETLAGIAREDATFLRRQLLGWHFHDWTADPYSRGAYSYQVVGGANAPKRLARPIEGTLFFTGEATEGGESGTVHGAISSGRRAARALLR